MKRYLLFVLLLIAAGQGMAQYVGNGIQGKLDPERRTDSIIGSPYLYNDWIKGAITLSSGETYSNLDLKFNLINNEVEYRGEKGENLVPEEEVKEFRIGANVFRAGFRSIEELNERTFYIVLYEGKITLLKHISREMKNEEPQSPTVTYYTGLVHKERYYISREGRAPVRIKKDRKALLEAIGSRSADLEKFITINNLTFKEDTDMALVVGYYNSL